MPLKILKPLFAAHLLACLTAHGTLVTFDSGFQNGGIVPDGNPTGWSDTRTISVLDTSVSDLNVFINISGGFNGDLIAYLSHNGVLVTLLNRVGASEGNLFGFSTAGFNNVTLDQSAGTSIHDVPTPSSASYAPDGGNLTWFNGSDPNGSWTLYVSDMAGLEGSTPSRVDSWGLEITAVPEPMNQALAIFAGLGLVVAVWRRNRSQKNRTAAS